MNLSRRTRQILILSALTAIAVGIVVARRLQPAIAPAGSAPVLRVMSPAIRLVNWVDGGVSGALAGLLGLIDARSEAERLQGENDRLRREVAALSEALRRSGRWPALAAAAEALALPTAAGDVIAVGPHPDYPTLLLDIGQKEGAVVGAPVLAAAGLAGRVIESTEHQAAVRLLPARDLWVTAVLASNEALGVVRGLGGSDHLQFVPEDQGIHLMPGQQILTAGREESPWPRGIPIGVIVETGVNRRGVRHALVTPAVDMHRLQEVLIVLGPSPRHRPLEGRRLAESLAVTPEPTSAETELESVELEMASEELSAVSVASSREAQ